VAGVEEAVVAGAAEAGPPAGAFPAVAEASAGVEPVEVGDEI